MDIGRAESRTGEQRKVSDRWRCTDGSVVLRFSGGFYGERHKWFNSGDVPQCLLCGYVTGVPHCRSTEQRSAQSMTDRWRCTDRSALSMGEAWWGEYVVLVLEVSGTCSARCVAFHPQPAMCRPACQQLVTPPLTPPPAQPLDTTSQLCTHTQDRRVIELEMLKQPPKKNKK